MGRWAVFIIIIILLMPCGDVSADSGSDVLMTSVIPIGQSEGIALTNYGPEDVPLDQFTLTDGEGTVSFTDVTLRAHSTLFILKSQPEGWMGDIEYIINGEGCTFKGFALNDSGDDIYLMKGDDVIDSFVYGNITTDVGWSGDSFPRIRKCSMACRTSVFDTDTSADWSSTVPGRSSFDAEDEGYDALVSPIVFPDNGLKEILTVISDAEERIDLSVYILSHPAITAELKEKIKQGVKVRILAEGSPVGGVNESEIAVLSALSNAGAEVCMMKSDNGYRRYTYNHSKYAVVDDDITVITSENWIYSSFAYNRGWGAIIRSQEMNSYMEQVFSDDFSGSDTIAFRELYPDTKGESYYREDHTCQLTWHHCTVHPVVSPDNSLEQMHSLMANATDRIYSQQLEVEYSWTSVDDNPLQWMYGDIDSRLLIDVTFDSDSDDDYEDGYGIAAMYSEDPNLDVRTSAYDGLSHNKGVIVDSKVWIGSVNWKNNSFNYNREAAVIIDSDEVSEFYASYFLADWELSAEKEKGIMVLFPSTVSSDETFIIDARGSVVSDDSFFRWDIDGDGEFDREGKRIALRLGAGEHRILLKVNDGDDTYQEYIDIDVIESHSIPEIIPSSYLPVVLICISVLVWKAIRWSRGRRRDRKGVHTR